MVEPLRSRNGHHRIQEVPFYLLRPDVAGQAIEREVVPAEGEVLSQVGNRAEAARDRRAQQYPQGVHRARRHHHPRRAQDSRSALACVVEPNLVPACDRLDRLYVAQFAQHRPGLDRARDQRLVHAHLCADIAIEPAEVTLRAWRLGGRIVAGPADRLSRQREFPLLLGGERRQHADSALILRSNRNLEFALDSRVVGRELGLRQFRRQRVEKLGRRTLQQRATHHGIAAHDRGVHHDAARVDRELQQTAARYGNAEAASKAGQVHRGERRHELRQRLRGRAMPPERAPPRSPLQDPHLQPRARQDSAALAPP